MGHIKLYNTWKQVKEVFAKPKLNFNIKICDSKPCVRLGNYKNYYLHSNSNLIKSRESGTYIVNHHKTPCVYVWKKPIRTKLKKLGLGWIKPIISLPKIFAFDIINRDVTYKIKWDTYYHEYNPRFSLILFGIEFIWTLECPKEDEFCDDSHYWELLLEYLYGSDKGSLYKSIGHIWSRGARWNVQYYFQLRRCYLQPEYQPEYDKLTEDYKQRHRNRKKIA